MSSCYGRKKRRVDFKGFCLEALDALRDGRAIDAQTVLERASVPKWRAACEAYEAYAALKMMSPS